ncbi:phosphonate ABC transporter ATP-binding protein [Corynebacterium hylobatis]|uniref:Phosphonate ABC transporter ATP-binding protein n=1 Tax=Corynebacterium hylobatis TaxID=1859290 RepID=A0A430HYQ5_9CORY|nr:phosphonate ABC transporter ATP-binding protein [Corynebacterium hylobatis]RSZ63811.1 phosphonate ABC transporter ATP-binding protein [Corynebacterium hylobatis]
MTAVVRARRLTVRFGGNTALEAVDLDVHAGEVVALLGPSGSGKSTLLRALTRMVPTVADELAVAGRDVNKLRGGQLRALRSDVGYVFQHFHLVPTLSCLTNVLTGGLHEAGTVNLLGMFSTAQRAKALALLERVGLEQRARERCRVLSGGQQQRVAIARALMQDPQLLLADEPVSSLDPQLADSVLALLREVAAERGIPVLMSLHAVDLARTHADRIIGLRHGRVIIDSRAHQLDDAALTRLYQPAPEVHDAQ